jgi:uncharacterized protein YdaU (DUF1376 family)
MAKDPAFLFYPNDWIGGTMGMTFEEKGAYMELLMMQFNRGHMTKHMMAHTVGLILAKILDKFEIDDKGLYFNRRLEEEKDKRKSFVLSRVKNKKGNNQFTKKEGHMTSHMEDVNIIIDYTTISNFYKTALSKFLIETFKENKAEKYSEIKTFEMIVVEMNKIWEKHKPTYTFLQEADYPALLQIAYLIAKVKKISKHDAVNDELKKHEILKSFETITEFLVNTDIKFFFGLNLGGISKAKNFQSLIETMKDLTPKEKSKKLEEKRIGHEEYFENQ